MIGYAISQVLRVYFKLNWRKNTLTAVEIKSINWWRRRVDYSRHFQQMQAKQKEMETNMECV